MCQEGCLIQVEVSVSTLCLTGGQAGIQVEVHCQPSLAGGYFGAQCYILLFSLQSKHKSN